MIKVYDDILSDRMLDRLKSIVYNRQDTIWQLCQTASQSEEHCSFADVINTDGGWKGEFYSNLNLHLQDQLESRGIKLSKTNLIRIRVGLILRESPQIKNNAHVDYNEEHLTGLLYLNDTDGVTTIYKEKYDSSYTELTSHDNPSEQYLQKMYGNQNNLTIQEEIEPKSNRFLLFDGLQYHCSQTPTKSQLRFAITFNWT